MLPQIYAKTYLEHAELKPKDLAALVLLDCTEAVKEMRHLSIEKTLFFLTESAMVFQKVAYLVNDEVESSRTLLMTDYWTFLEESDSLLYSLIRKLFDLRQKSQQANA